MSRAVADDTSVLTVRDLRTQFRTRRGLTRAVDGVTFNVMRGETLGIVGESGSGKSVLALSLVRLIPPPGRIVGGEVLLGGRDLLGLSEREMSRVRGGGIALILQDPMTSLNPVLTIGDQIVETLAAHRRTKGRDYKRDAIELLRRVNVPAPELRLGSYPHQLSGGMRQRVAGAIAIACEPSVIIADEPTTSLDATIQLQYLRLLREIQVSTGVAIIFITHDFGIVAQICDRVAVMYAGHIVEVGSVNRIFEAPAHPYTRALLAAVPEIGSDVRRLPTIPGQPPALDALPSGCPFHPRCPLATDRCWSAYPPDVAVAPGHHAVCWEVA